MEDFFHDYTAGEFLEWLEDEDASLYINQEVESVDGESVIFEMFDIEQLKTNFMRQSKRYTVVRRGFKFYIHDEHSCHDIAVYKFDSSNESEIQDKVNEFCDSLNNREISFVGKNYRCD